jgi:hypothetical protein
VEEIQEVNELIKWWNWYVSFVHLFALLTNYEVQPDIPRFFVSATPALQEQCTLKDQG